MSWCSVDPKNPLCLQRFHSTGKNGFLFLSQEARYLRRVQNSTNFLKNTGDLMFRAFIFLLLAFPCFSQDFAFKGQHFLASYLDCDSEALQNPHRLIEAMDEAVLASGATILGKSSFVFEPDGLTIVYLLSESHASVHTYPEHNACFVDLFTCGDHCSSEGFDRSLQNYLQPKTVEAKNISRGRETAIVSP